MCPVVLTRTLGQGFQQFYECRDKEKNDVQWRECTSDKKKLCGYVLTTELAFLGQHKITLQFAV